MTDEPIDTTAEEIADAPTTSTASTAVAVRERRSEVIRPLDPDALVESFTAYQELLPRLLNDTDYQAAEAGKKFVKKSGWRKIATAFDLDVQIIGEEVERDPATGRILRAKTTARATAPSGRSMDGDGYCTIDEFTGRRASNPKLENDLRGTAATRAKNRAISDLVGMGEVSAEEVDAGHSSPSLPAWAAPASDELFNTVAAALSFLISDPAVAGATLARLTADTDGVMTAAVARAVVMTISAYKNNLQPEPASSPAEPEPEPSHDQLDMEAAKS